jgi:hypothetical protein
MADVENLSTHNVDKSAKVLVNGELIHRKDMLWARWVADVENLSTHGDKLLAALQTLQRPGIAMLLYVVCTGRL